MTVPYRPEQVRARGAQKCEEKSAEKRDGTGQEKYKEKNIGYIQFSV